MSELDNLEQLQHFDQHGLLARAADWPARRDAVRTVPVTNPQIPDQEWLCLLPPELLPLGHLATMLAPPSAERPIWIYPAAVRLGTHPSAILAAVPPAKVRALGTHPTDQALADVVAAAPHQDLYHIANADRHLTDSLLDLPHLFERIPGRSHPHVQPDDALDNALAGLTPEICLADNVAKQIAQQMHERLPIFWGTGEHAHIAALWAMRQQWTAERAAFALTTGDLARSGLLARLPRYWPNAAHFFQLGSTISDEKLTTVVTYILSRRRFPTQMITTPPDLMPRARCIYLLELGEWVALYSAYLAHADPSARTPHSILFDA